MSVLKLQPEGSYKNPFLSNLSLNWACSQQKAYLVAAEPSHVLNGGPIKDISNRYQLSVAK
jgi:hypothetical protein